MAKLLGNLINGIQVVIGDGEEAEELHERAMAEARACFDAAGLKYESQLGPLGSRMSTPRPVHGEGHANSSSWQSLERGTGTIETDSLNGEIVLLGRLHGIPTPVNDAVQSLATRMAREHLLQAHLDPPGVCPLNSRLGFACPLQSEIDLKPAPRGLAPRSSLGAGGCGEGPLWRSRGGLRRG